MSQVQSFFVTLTMEFDPFFEQFNIANYFWTVSAIALIIHIFHMSIPPDKTFLWTPLFFHPVTLTLEFDPFYLKTLNLLITFEQRVLELCYITWVFQVTTPFRRYQHFLTLWSWPSLELAIIRDICVSQTHLVLIMSSQIILFELIDDNIFAYMRRWGNGHNFHLDGTCDGCILQMYTVQKNESINTSFFVSFSLLECKSM